jgi:Tfp pilus assembly protein PilF
MFAAFLILIWVFYQYVERTHVGKWRAQQAADQYLRAGGDYYQKAKYDLSAGSFEEGLIHAPDNFDLHYNIALIYTYHIKNSAKALYHWDKCLQINPQSEKIGQVMAGKEYARLLP